MSSLSLRLPESLHLKLREIARKDHVSINQFIATAVAEKTAAVLTLEYLEERGRRADPRGVDRLLSRVPDVDPIPGDELPPARVSETAPQSDIARHSRNAPLAREERRVPRRRRRRSARP